MFAVCINNILSTEYPENWPEFLPTIKNIMSSQDKHTIDAALLILWELFNIYRYKSTDKREPLNIMISETFSQLFNTCNSLIALNEPEAGKMVHMILKIYYAAVQFELSPLLQSEPSITQWLTLFVTVIEKQVTINESLDEQEREQYSWFKAKKWALHCVYHLFVKYAIAPQNSGDLKYAQFSSIFMNNFAPNILNVYLNQVGLISSGTWTSNRVKQQISLFLTDCVKQKNLWLIMKPNLELIVVKYIFPILCVTDFDLYQWESDPVEYIQRKLDVMQDFKSSVTAAQELLTGIVKNRFKQTFIPIISFVNEILSAYNSTSVELRDARKKDGAINLISCLANEMLGKVFLTYLEITYSRSNRRIHCIECVARIQ